MILPRASHVTRSALPVRLQRASKSWSDASRRDEQKSSAYHSSDNETTSIVRAHTHTHARARVSRTYHVYSHPRGIARVRSSFTSFFSPFLFLGTKFARSKSHNRFGATAFGLRSDNTAVNPRFTAIRVHVYARASRLSAIRDTHTYTRAQHARIYACTHAHTPNTVWNSHRDVSAVVRAWFATRA